MKIRFEEDFLDSLSSKIEYIAKDNPSAAKRFKKELLSACCNIENMHYKHRKSIYHNDESVRDLVFKGYVVVYLIESEMISVFALINQERYNQG